jgi:hypothetical protein
MLKRLMWIGILSVAAIFVLTELCSAAAIAEREPIVEGPQMTTVLDTGQVLFQFTAPFNNTDGMAWDGTNLWIGCDGVDRIWKVDTLGNFLDSIPTPAVTATGLTWDGEYLWCADGGTFRIYKLDPATGAILDSIPSPGTAVSCEGLAWMNDTLWNTNWNQQFIWALDPATGAIWNQFGSPGTGSTGLTWDWVDNALWNSDQLTDQIYKLDPVTGTVITSFACPDAEVQDLAFDGTCMWTCGWTSGEVYKMDIGYVGVQEHEPSQAVITDLHVSPNPFSNRVDIRFQITDNSTVDLKIYDTSGKLVRQFDRTTMKLSDYISWYGTDDFNQRLPNGVYFMKLKAGNYTTTQKLLLIR